MRLEEYDRPWIANGSAWKISNSSDFNPSSNRSKRSSVIKEVGINQQGQMLADIYTSWTGYSLGQ